MIELSMGSFIAAFVAGILGFGGAVGAANGATKALCLALLAVSLASMVSGLLRRRKPRNYADPGDALIETPVGAALAATAASPYRDARRG